MERTDAAKYGGKHAPFVVMLALLPADVLLPSTIVAHI